MSKKLTTNQFIEKVKAVHGDKYDYSLVEYKNARTKVKIICPIHGMFKQVAEYHLSGSGCPKCVDKRLTTEQFIKRSNEIHNNKYDYSLVEYKNNKTKVKIVCSIHGMFEQVTGDHLRGRGCPKCGKNKKCIKQRNTTEQFIEKAKAVHGDKYDYSLVEYKNVHTKVKIVCSIHGMFEQRPSIHLCGSGCPKCGIIIMSNNKKLTTNQFIEKAKAVHGDKYDYSLVEYKNSGTKVKIICPIHGVFEQRSYDHLRGRGCFKCNGNKKLTTKEFIEKANTIHGDKYDYSLVEYKNNKTKVKIICPVHGVFEQVTSYHLSGNSCPV
jgi:predicted  nucleic acid-binding Zn-ribbon protein